MTVQKCLVIADDLTGGADAGAQFAKRGLSAYLVTFKEAGPCIEFSRCADKDVLVVSTDSRGLSPEKASKLVSDLLKNYDPNRFPVIYKKIDSTLRGNIGQEIDAILKETKIPICFMAPSYPEQNRRLVGGIMMVGEKPLALTEASMDTASPVLESHVSRILENQSAHKIGKIDLTRVASNDEQLQQAVEEEKRKGNRIIIFDAISRQNLTNIADAAFRMETKPLFVGSAGLAEEVAKKLSPQVKTTPRSSEGLRKGFDTIFIISGSASNVTHRQLDRLQARKIPTFQLDRSVLKSAASGELSLQIAGSLTRGHAVLRTSSERMMFEEPADLPIHRRITKTLASLALSAMKQSKVDAGRLALILTGGDTALSVLDLLRPCGIEIEGELLEGIVKGYLSGGIWNGLSLVTKAGGFGKEDGLLRIIELLETGERKP